MQYNSEIKEFMQEHTSLPWWIKPEAGMNININPLVEPMSNHGDEKSVKRFFSLFGIKVIADMLYGQMSGKWSNDHRRTKHFFQLYYQV